MCNGALVFLRWFSSSRLPARGTSFAEATHLRIWLPPRAFLTVCPERPIPTAFLLVNQTPAGPEVSPCPEIPHVSSWAVLTPLFQQFGDDSAHHHFFYKWFGFGRNDSFFSPKKECAGVKNYGENNCTKNSLRKNAGVR